MEGLKQRFRKIVPFTRIEAITELDKTIAEIKKMGWIDDDRVYVNLNKVLKSLDSMGS